MERRAIHEQLPRATGEFSCMVIILLLVASLGMCQNDFDGAFVTEKVADGAVRCHVEHTFLDCIRERGKGSGHVWDDLQKRMQGIKSGVGGFQEDRQRKR